MSICTNCRGKGSKMAARSESASERAERDVHITRLLAAPRTAGFTAWLDAEALARWFAPNGCSVRFPHFDPRPGGEYHLCIRAPGGPECWCKGVYREIVPPERIVFTMVISDAGGNSVGPTDVGMDPEWPRETVVTVTFAEHGDQTMLTLHQTVSEALAKRTGALPSWLEMLEKLAAALAHGDDVATTPLRGRS
jgi:uncharacterized protein YndB with AHSA1/START domain